MRSSFAAVVVAVVVAGCSSAPKGPPPELHSSTYHEAPPAPAFVAKPVGAAPTSSQIRKDVQAWAYTNSPDPDKVEFDGPEGKPPAVRNASPGLYQGSLTVARGLGEFAGPETVVYEKQPTHEVRVWVNAGAGFKLHKFHYIDGALVTVE